MSRIACVMTNMFEDSEYTSPLEAFEKEGHTVTVIEKEKGKKVTGKNGEAEVETDMGIDDADPASFDALFIPGGFSPDILRADDRFVAFSKHFVLHDKPIFAICHGPQLLITADVLYGRKMTGFVSIQVDLRHAGAVVFDEEVVVDHGLVTSRTPHDLDAFNRESVKQLKA
ncbi:type 1 glutamine amidotransferase domain-containing protein [Alkalicoccus chagannorensis]|uniref:type 1 glutamine amidotransferase domain-containing protein n=1 Tax=Alkalicoccus chagannorensis TaxID=427072 RepID=UPI00040A10F4|nr:type 1 glutamine amidotransferase domain-containing protein [Alkalicoccus chagannorensis]